MSAKNRTVDELDGPEGGEEGRNVRRTSRRPRLRFGLKTLFVVAILFSLFFGWVGKNLYEARQDQAAIETILRAGDDLALVPKIRWEGHAPGGDASAKLGALDRVLIALNLAERPKLRGVYLYSDRPGDPSLRPALQAMQRFPEIRDVTFVGRGFDDEAIAALTESPNLETLELMYTWATGKPLAALAGHEKLTSLQVVGERRVDGLAAGLAELKSLEFVVLSEMPIERADVKALAALPRLKQALLNDVRLADEGDLLMPLAECDALRHLAISLPAREAETLEGLPRIERLETLSLDGVTDETLANLAATPTLREALLNQPISAEGARAFSASHPDCDVVYFGGNSAFRFRGGEIVQ